MKVILLQNVKKVGKQGEIVDVADGYANGFLIPKKLAKPASHGVVQEQQQKQIQKINSSLKEKENDRELFLKVSEKTYKITAAANEKGHLFASIGIKDLVESINSTEKVAMSEPHILLKEPIKSLGDFEIDIKIGENRGKITASILKK